MPQRFNNGGGGTQLIRRRSTRAPLSRKKKKKRKINDYEYVYLFARCTVCANLRWSCFCCIRSSGPRWPLGAMDIDPSRITALTCHSASAGPSNIPNPRSYVATRQIEKYTQIPTFAPLPFSGAAQHALRLLQVREPPSRSHNHVRAAWHYRKIMMCRPVGSFISMFYNRRRVEVIKLCHHYNEPGPPLNRHPMRH